MHGNLSSASVILHVVSETECLLAEDRGKFLLLLNLLFVKDPTELIEGVLGLTAEGREVLCGILADVDMVPGTATEFIENSTIIFVRFYLLEPFIKDVF